jgi:hypothetical protein
METRALSSFRAFVTSGIQCDTGEEFFIWIRRNPLKSPDSTKEIQGNPSYFPWIHLDLAWISLDEFAGRADRLASPVRLVELGAKRKPKLRSIALELADVACV